MSDEPNIDDAAMNQQYADHCNAEMARLHAEHCDKEHARIFDSLREYGPAMLDALRLLISCADSSPFMSVGHFLKHRATGLRDIVAKAEGRAE